MQPGNHVFATFSGGLIVSALRYCALFAIVTMAAFVGLALGADTMIRRAGLASHLDNGSPASNGLFGRTGELATIYNRQGLNAARPNLIVLGASSAIKLLDDDLAREAQHHPALQGYAISNMSVMGLAFPGFGEVAELAYRAMPPASRGKTIFVVGSYYGFFYQTELDRFERTFRDNVRAFGLYDIDPTGRFRETMPSAVERLALEAFRPLILLRRHWFSAKDIGSNFTKFAMTGAPVRAAPDAEFQNNFVLTDADKRALNASRERNMVHVEPHAIAALTNLARIIASHGDRLVIVDLPLPAWHRQASTGYSAYCHHKADFLGPALATGTTDYLDLSTLLADDDFVDLVHPRPSANPPLAKALIAGIASLPPHAGPPGPLTCAEPG